MNLTLALFLVPAVAGLGAFAIRSNGLRRFVLLLVAAAHCVMTSVTWRLTIAGTLGEWLRLDDFGRLFLSITSVLFATAAVYTVAYLRREEGRQQRDPEEGFLFVDAPEATFTGCLLLFLSTMTLVAESQHLGLLWVAVEATTLASAPLIFFHRHHRSLEATWKYLMICSVGIALALLGNFLLTVSAALLDQKNSPLLLANLLNHAAILQASWLKVAFIFLLVGYGTKMGLAPLHTWLPDAHSESPSVVSALLSGALLNCALLGIIRAYQVCIAAGLRDFASNLMVFFGLFSMAVAAVFIIGQADYKRMLAYSSVEHMGILSLGIGLGGSAAFGAVLHAVNHSLTKAMLFLVAGNILAGYRTKAVSDVKGLLRALPASGVLWLAGLFAITGTPPFGPFLSEFTILKGALELGRWIPAAIYLGLLAVIFVGMLGIVLRMTQGDAPAGIKTGTPVRDNFFFILPPTVLAILVTMLGLYIPPPLTHALHDMARALGGY